MGVTPTFCYEKNDFAFNYRRFRIFLLRSLAEKHNYATFAATVSSRPRLWLGIEKITNITTFTSV